ncbi:transcription factor-like protein DPB isoform X2 [Asparagus officinalis]|uniref:transcription factor-like protein DPB isoform X2 n=1 Tax=Asparagus officinalis TaxID=4686 RepID=UPI00098E12BB|nr:transcription factor-like protein DPB isoform X2 [Asparagus officinalis]
MISSNHQIDLPDGLDEAHVNPQSGTSNGDTTGEDITPSSSDNMLRLDDSYIQEDGNIGTVEKKKKKKASRIIGWGLRRFSTIVCRKVQAKGRTTYNEVADEIIAELSSGLCILEQFDEKNIRRRVYDAFNVLIAINVIAKDKKEIRWIGSPITKTEQVKHLEEAHVNMMSRIQTKTNYLRELERQLVDLQNLMLRNQQLHQSGNVASEGIHLPFVLVRAHRKATVEIEISEDAQLVHFDFNDPYSLYNEQAILKMMRCPHVVEPEQTYRNSSIESLINDQSSRPLKSSLFSWNSEMMSMKN